MSDVHMRRGPPQGGNMAERIRTHDWADTPLGAAEHWPPALRIVLETVLAAAFPMAVYWGPQLRMLYNDAFVPILGPRHPAALGQAAALVWADVWEQGGPLLQRVLEHGETRTLDGAPFLIDSLHGRPQARYFDGSCSPITDLAGATQGVLAVVAETTPQVHARQDNERLLTHARDTVAALRESEARFRFLDVLGQTTRQATDATVVMALTAQLLGEHLDASRCAYADVEPDGNGFTIRSDWTAPGLPSSAGVYSLELFGPRAVAELNSARTLVVCNVDDELGEEGGGQMFRAIGIQAIICAPLVKDGRLAAMMAVHQATPRHWAEAEVALVQEVVERCWAHIERVRDAARLQEQDARKNEFLAMLAHELRNPLAPLTNAHRLLARDAGLTPGSSALLAMAERQTRQLTRLVDDLLEISRITRGKIELRPQSMDVSLAVHAAVDSVMPMIEQRRHRVDITVSGKPASIVADAARVAQVLENLLHNAIKYTPVGGVIGIDARDHGDAVEISVTDNGIGINPDKIGQLFQPFMQIDATIDRSQGGLGIGLALAKRLVELHGGSIAAESPGLGKGSTFRVKLPRQPLQAQPAPQAS